MINFIGTSMPEQWLYGREERKIINLISDKINSKWPNDRNLLINLTWLGVGFDNGLWTEVCKIIEKKEHYDRVIMLSTVDPLFITPDEVQWLNDNLPTDVVYWAGNYQSDHEFNFFAIVGKRLFHRYEDSSVIMTQPKYLFLNYNRKPRQHRIDFVRKLLTSGLAERGAFTLGRDKNNIFSQENDLYFTLGENQNDYKDCMHAVEGFDIPDDVLSLHNMHYWQNHFLNIVGATQFWPWDPIFVTESQFKPMIGLRPFVINGNTNTYQWLERNGFRTFNKYFPVDLEVHETCVHDSIIEVLRYLETQNLQDLYNQMMPDLLYNKNRFYEFADEQEYKLNHLFDKD
jgi:hypothetical protein